MTKFLSAMAVVCCATTSALAGNLLPAPDTTTVNAPVVTNNADWSGFYGGAFVSFGGGTLDYSYPPADPFLDNPIIDLTTYGAFAGINFQNDAFVYGAEAAISSGGYRDVISNTPSNAMSSVIDLKGRAGYSFGAALVYGVVGYSFTDWTTSATYFVSGMNYGVGIDYIVNDHLFVGAEYLMRDMSGYRENNDALLGHTNLNSAHIRAGWKF